MDEGGVPCCFPPGCCSASRMRACTAVRQKYGAEFMPTFTVTPVEQPRETFGAVRQALSEVQTPLPPRSQLSAQPLRSQLDVWRLTALNSLTNTCKASLIGSCFLLPA